MTNFSLSKQEIKMLKKFAFTLALTSYRRLVLTFYAFKGVYLVDTFGRCWMPSLDDGDYQYFKVMQDKAILLKKRDLLICYSLVCKCYAERIKKYGYFEITTKE